MQLPGIKAVWRERPGWAGLYLYPQGGGPRLWSATGATRADLLARMAAEADAIARAYAASRAPSPVGGRLSGLIRHYRMSPEWTGLRSSTHRVWSPHLDALDDTFGHVTLRELERPGFRTRILEHRDSLADRPRTADLRMQVLGRVLSWGTDREHLARNPATRIGKLYAADRAALIWTPEEIAAVLAAAPPHVGRLVRWIELTGMRAGDTAAVTWSDVHADRIERPTAKSNRRQVMMAPRSAAIDALLRDCPRVSVCIHTKATGRPWTNGASVSKAVARAMRAAGVRPELHLHDLRGTAVTRWLSEGWSATQIALLAGWSDREVSRILGHYAAFQNLAKRA